MAKYEVANSGSRDHIPGQMECSCKKLKIEGLVGCTKVLIDSHSQLPFTTTCAISSTKRLHQLQDYSSGTRISSQSKGREHSKY